MSRDFSPRMHWAAHLQNQDLYFTNIEYSFNGKKWLLYTEKELEDRRKHKALAVLGADIYKRLREELSDDEFEELNETLQELADNDFGGKETGSFPDKMTDWYYNRHAYYYHEPNDKEFMEYIIRDRVRKQKLKDLAKDIFNTRDQIEGYTSGGIDAPKYIISVRELNNLVTIKYKYAPVCGLSDCQYHAVQDEFSMEYHFNDDGTFKGDIRKAIDPFDDYKLVPYLIDGFLERHPEYNSVPESDSEVEEKWAELEDVLFKEDENKELILAHNWFLFSEGSSREDIWKWFDKKHSKGVAWLMHMC